MWDIFCVRRLMDKARASADFSLLVLLTLSVFSWQQESGYLLSCSDYKRNDSSLTDGNYIIDPDGDGGLAPFTVFCDMSDKDGVGVTVISHDSETRIRIDGCKPSGCYNRSVRYSGARMDQLTRLTNVSAFCEQSIKVECHDILLSYGSWLVSRDGIKMDYWGGASPGSKKCKCGMVESCSSRDIRCNCDIKDFQLREDSGLLTYKRDLPVSQLRFGNTNKSSEYGYYTLGKLKCYGLEACSCISTCLSGETCTTGIIDKKCQTGPLLSCSDYKTRHPSLASGYYIIDPDGEGQLDPFTVFCDMSDKDGVGVTVVSHDSENSILVNGSEGSGAYSHIVSYNGVTLDQLGHLTRTAAHCEQFINYTCYNADLNLRYGSWLMSRTLKKMTYWGGAPRGNYSCACKMNNSCHRGSDCNCNGNDDKWLEDSGLLSYKSDLPVSMLKFGDTGEGNEHGYHTLGKLKCYGFEACSDSPCLNGGTCLGLVSGYECKCPVGYTNERCETEPMKWELVWAPLISVALFGALLYVGWRLRRRCRSDKRSLEDPSELAPIPPPRRRRPSDLWEVRESEVYIQGFLGVGAFGEVWRAVVQHVGGIRGNRECAVKKLRGCVSSETKNNFFKEIEIGKILGSERHPNIVRFLGCVTLTEPAMIIMEYTPYGDLLGFMRKSRGVEDRHHVGENLPVRELNNYDLVNFSQQVACGMTFLQSKNILHRDLATRNVLVTKNFVCKVTDFGMAFQTTKYRYGTAKTGRLPTKWTAPEVLLKTSTFQISSKSDVWSYGIVLYEIFTLGGTPYPEFGQNDLLAQLRINQYRMPKPEHISDDIYDIMMQCWREDPSDRPTFEELQQTFMNMIAEEFYLDVFDKAKYENELYQPEKFVSDVALTADPQPVPCPERGRTLTF